LNHFLIKNKRDEEEEENIPNRWRREGTFREARSDDLLTLSTKNFTKSGTARRVRAFVAMSMSSFISLYGKKVKRSLKKAGNECRLAVSHAR
jgi:hypothetical protein